MAGITLRLARSPDAPNKTTVTGSATVAAALPIPSRFTLLAVTVAMCVPIQNLSRSTLYLNTVFLQFRSQLRRVLVQNHVHAHASRVLQIERPVVNEDALLGGTLRDLQCHAI